MLVDEPWLLGSVATSLLVAARRAGVGRHDAVDGCHHLDAAMPDLRAAFDRLPIQQAASVRELVMILNGSGIARLHLPALSSGPRPVLESMHSIFQPPQSALGHLEGDASIRLVVAEPEERRGCRWAAAGHHRVGGLRRRSAAEDARRPESVQVPDDETQTGYAAAPWPGPWPISGSSRVVGCRRSGMPRSSSTRCCPAPACTRTNPARSSWLVARNERGSFACTSG